MFCTKCGSSIEEGMTFCPKCGNKVGEAPGISVEENANVIVKSKKECIYDAFCNFLRADIIHVGINPSFGELENYEEGANGMVYCELVSSARNALGQTKKRRYGAVIREVEEDGNVVFKGIGPQLMTPLNGTALTKKALGFKAR